MGIRDGLEDRRGKNNCIRCGKLRDTALQNCSACLKTARTRYSNKGRRIEFDPDDGWDDTLPMERPLETAEDRGTVHRPGSVEKIVVMVERYVNGLPLFRLDDSEGAVDLETSNREKGVRV